MYAHFYDAIISLASGKSHAVRRKIFHSLNHGIT